MKRIIIKIPKDINRKWSLQQRGVVARRFRNATTLFNHLERRFPRKEFKEKLAIEVKGYMDGRFVTDNETLPSKDAKYSLYATACFLEDYLSSRIIKKAEKRYL